MDLSRMSTRFEIKLNIVLKAMFSYSRCCAPPVPLLSEIGGTCPRQLYGADASSLGGVAR